MHLGGPGLTGEGAKRGGGGGGGALCPFQLYARRKLVTLSLLCSRRAGDAGGLWRRGAPPWEGKGQLSFLHDWEVLRGHSSVLQPFAPQGEFGALEQLWEEGQGTQWVGRRGIGMPGL